MDNLKIAFTYEGESSLGSPDEENSKILAGRVELTADEEIKSKYQYYPFGSESTKKFYDYSPIRSGGGKLRLWMCQPSYPRDTGDYIVPDTSGSPKRYTLYELGLSKANPSIVTSGSGTINTNN